MPSDLEMLSEQQKTLLLVDAVSVVKPLIIRTYKNEKKSTNAALYRIQMSV